MRNEGKDAEGKDAEGRRGCKKEGEDVEGRRGCGRKERMRKERQAQWIRGSCGGTLLVGDNF